MSNQKLAKTKKSRLKNRRAVTEIISTMMLMGVTITGASTLTYFVNDAFVSGNLASASSFDSSKNILLLAYNTRDSSTSGIELDASVDYLPGADRKYPADGMFSILPVGSSPIIQNEDIQIQSGQIVNLLIKLGSDDSDIGLNKGVHIRLDMGGMRPVELFIETGDAR
ncbi:MAG: hypothetical protein MJK05_09010 [Nitrosopumilus sp.]|nr:hypothetical protein [Nitrosopumilus sp.]